MRRTLSFKRHPALRLLVLAAFVVVTVAGIGQRTAQAAGGKAATRAASRAGARPLRRGSASTKSRPPTSELAESVVRRPEVVEPSGTLIAPDEAPPPDLSDPDRPRILRLQEALSSIVHGPVLGRMRVGMRVLEAGTGRTF